MNSTQRRIIGWALVVLVMATAGYVTFFRTGQNGLQGGIESGAEGAGGNDVVVPEDLRSLQALYRTVNLVQKHYIDPARIDSRQMFVAAAKAMQRHIAKVLVEEHSDELLLRLGSDKLLFVLPEITTPWILLQRIKALFQFVKERVGPEEVDLQEVEYAAINGMLQTLDPHSALLNPDIYRDMRDKTRGKFGGLGIVISIRDGVLTVISPIDGTPADLAGLQAGDQIVKIGEVSTVNMALNDAVNLLRGEPGTVVTVHILRKGWDVSRDFDIVRAIVKVESVESEMLSGRVGYVRIKDFQGNTAFDLDDHLKKLEKKAIRGLVIDLRRNPGGLLEAAIQVADRFLKKGVIVTTAGQGPAQRDVRRARDQKNEPDYPIVVLVNSGSASASEIVAGALKNHGRALLVGERTFGKGSVQVLYDFNDGSALKLTTAQYLTPGDRSIQSIGVVPHVELLPMRADKEMLDLIVEAGYREADLDHHFEIASPPKGEGLQTRPEISLKHLWTPPVRDSEDEGDGEGGSEGDETGLPDPEIVADKDKPFEPDFTTELARELALKLGRTGGDVADIGRLRPVLEETEQGEQKKLVAALAQLGINWERGEPSGEADVDVRARFLGKGGAIKPGEEQQVAVSVTNRGKKPLYRVLATSASDFRPLDDRELAFGKIAPGQTMEKVLDFKVFKDALTRVDDVRFTFTDAFEQAMPSVALRFAVEALPRPRFAYNFQIDDTEGGNGDSRLQAGEHIKFTVDIKNAGEGTALDTFVTLKSLSGDQLFMVQGREDMDEIPPRERREGTFTFDIKPNFDESQARLELTVADVELKAYAVEKIEIPIKPPIAVRPTSSAAKAVKDSAAVLAEPAPEARVLAVIPEGKAALVTGETNAFYRIALKAGRIGWVLRSDFEQESDLEPDPPALVVNAPPVIEIDSFAQVVRSETVTLKGLARDEKAVRDLYIFVGEDKVFFQDNPDDAPGDRLRFSAKLPLEYGVNYITVVAEETAELDTRVVLTVRRDRDDGMPYLMSRSLSGDPEPLGVVPTVSRTIEEASPSDNPGPEFVKSTEHAFVPAQGLRAVQ